MPKHKPFLKIIIHVFLVVIWNTYPGSYLAVINADERPFGIAIIGDPHLPGKELRSKENLLRTINSWEDIDRVVALGYKFKRVFTSVIAKGDITEELLEQCRELGGTLAGGCEMGIY